MTQRARRRQRRTRRHKASKIFLGLTVVGAAVAIGVLSTGIWVLDVAAGAGTIADLEPIDKGETSVVLAADGSRLGFVVSDTIREEIDWEDMPQDIRDATVAIEDERFYEHDGVDESAVARAAWENLIAGEVVEGGSTITQQLVRNLFINEPENTIERKIQEAELAQQYEEQYSKDEILHEYLNTAPYGTVNGRTAVGIEAAAQIFFSKPARELSLKEAALLAGLPQAPTDYNPFLNEGGATARRNDVLDAMAAQGYITMEEAADAKQQGLGLSPSDRYSQVKEPFFFDYVETELIERYGVNTVRQGGLVVHTSIDPAMQDLATSAVVNQVSTLGGPSGALVSIDPSDGRIVAMASSGDYSEEQYNLAAQGNRQPGSSFKPFVLATAIEQGIDPDSTYYSGASPAFLDVGGVPWEVNNAEGDGGGSMSLASATTNSVNVVYARLGLDVGTENFVEMAHKLGIESPLNGYPAEAIGGLEVGVSPLEMANAYATFASGGVHHKPTAITRVEFPDGEEDVFESSEGERVITDGVAYEVTRLLKTVVQYGTGTNANYGCPAAGKTGTTDDFTDAWFVGYTPKLATAVWVGYPEGRISMGYSAFGGTYAAPIWNDFMSVASNGYCGDFPYPDNPASLSAFYSSNSTTGSSSSDDDYTDDSGGDGDGDDGDSSGDGGSGYDPDLYAPGAGQDPAPSLPGGGGGGGGDAPAAPPPAPTPEPAPPPETAPPPTPPDGGVGAG
jgi:penicillin-binding protein 1A